MVSLRRLSLGSALLLGGGSLLSTGCAPVQGEALDLSGTPTFREDVALSLSGVDWGFGWSGVTPDEDGWSVTNDLGITFSVAGGWLLNYSVTLVRCSETMANASTSWLSLIGVGTAHAGHETYEDPSEVEAQWGEQLRMLKNGSLGERTFEGDEYCGVHWLIARADADVFGEDGTELAGTSLSLEGSWRLGGENGDLQLRTDFTQGVVLRFPEHTQGVDGGPSFANLTLVRDASQLFDGIDPRIMNDYAVAWAMLENLANEVELSVELRKPTESKSRSARLTRRRGRE